MLPPYRRGLLYEGLLCMELHSCALACSAIIVRFVLQLCEFRGSHNSIYSGRALLKQALQVGILPRELQQHLVVEVLRHCDF